MSLSMYMFRNMMRPLRMLEQQMQMIEEIFPTVVYPVTIRSNRHPFTEDIKKTESITEDKDKFQVKLDVQNFTPQEITVKTAADNAIIIEAKHEEKQDNEGYISRQFIRRFILPKDHDLKDVISSLSSDGILTITAPKKVDATVQERIIPITNTGPEKNEKKSEDAE